MKIKKISQSAGVVANVVNDLNSDSTTDALSAVKGKELNNTHTLKTYTDPADFGLESYTSITEICQALPGGSILVFTSSEQYGFSDFTKMGYGTVEIIKQGAYRCAIRIIGSEANTNGIEWHSIWRTDSGLGPWYKVCKTRGDIIASGYNHEAKAGFLIKTHTQWNGDKYPLTITCFENTAPTTPTLTILNVSHGESRFTIDGTLHLGKTIEGITAKRLDVVSEGYIFIPIGAYSSIKVDSVPWVTIEGSFADGLPE